VMEGLEKHSSFVCGDSEKEGYEQCKALFKSGPRLSQSMIEAMKLNPGANHIEFSVTNINKIQGTVTVSADVHLWESETPILISDIDGTITKTDARGFVMTVILPGSYAHPGICSLLSGVHKNGYNVLYLSSRAIGEVDATRSYLHRLKQDGVMLPPGPCLVSPDRMRAALEREVVEKQPQAFKIPSLRCVLACYAFLANKHQQEANKDAAPSAEWLEFTNPFNAGFGNHETDRIAYNAVGISNPRVWLVDKKDVVEGTAEAKAPEPTDAAAAAATTDSATVTAESSVVISSSSSTHSSYAKMAADVDTLFPPRTK